MNKKKNNELIRKAENALHDPRVKILTSGGINIKDSYNGQTASFGITIAMAGLLPALTIYQQKTDECDRLQILNAIAVMLGEWNGDKPGEAMSKLLFTCNDSDLRAYQRKIIECSIALKQVIRTYNLIKS